MTNNALETFIEGARSAWGPLSTELAAKFRQLMAELAEAAETEPWLAELRRDLPESRELYRDPEHGFVLLANAEMQGYYRAPHDHGRGWVVYAVQHGEMEMGTFARVEDGHGARLVKRGSARLRAGDCRVYLPGDIHDTRRVSGEALMLRFTSCDLKVEEAEGRLKRYPEAVESCA